MNASGTAGSWEHAEIRARQLADAVAAVWWTAGGGDDVGIPLGVVAALSLAAASGQPERAFADWVAGLGPDGFASFLARVWGLFAITRPELSIRVGPLARWLGEENTKPRRIAAFGTAGALLDAGAFTADERPQLLGADLLGCVYQALANPRRSKARGEVYTSADVAELLMRIKLAGAQPGQSILDEGAGTGSLLRGAAQVLRTMDIDPRTMRWYASDIDPVAVAALAVNAHLWDLGPHIVLGRADILTEPDWAVRARDEQLQALRDHDLRLSLARLLAAENVISPDLDPQAGGRT